MTIALPIPAVAVPAAWRAHLAALTAVAAAILLLFRRDVAALIDIWWTSTTYGHCLFIAPVVAWLVWTRRGELARLQPVAWWPGLALVAVGGMGWLLGEAAGAAFARQLGLVMMLQGAVVTLLGPHVARGIAFPLGYALFMVPFGEWLEPPLQAITVAMVMPLLHLVGVPAAVDGVLIHAGRYYFEVAEACSGSKFVLSMAAYGVLVANVCFRSARRRAIFLVVALVIPVLANGVRAFGTIWAAELTSIEAATGFDHIVYGWIFFAFVMIAVMAVGWRWFDRAPDDAAFDPATLPPPRRRRIALLPAALATMLLAALFPVWSAAIAGRSQALLAVLAAPVVPDWTRVDPRTAAPWRPSYLAADRELFARYLDRQGNAVDLAFAVFAAQHEGKEVVAYGTGVLREGDRWLRVADLPAIDGGAAMRITAVGAAGTPVERVVATWYRVGGIVTSSPTIVKLATLKARLIGGEPGAVALHLSAERLPGRDPAAAVARFRAALGPIDQATSRALR